MWLQVIYSMCVLSEIGENCHLLLLKLVRTKRGYPKLVYLAVFVSLPSLSLSPAMQVFMSCQNSYISLFLISMFSLLSASCPWQSVAPLDFFSYVPGPFPSLAWPWSYPVCLSISLWAVSFMCCLVISVDNQILTKLDSLVRRLTGLRPGLGTSFKIQRIQLEKTRRTKLEL